MLNAQEFLAEGSVSNLFFVRDGVLFTPALDCGILPGVARRHVIELARRAGTAVKDGHFTINDLFSAEECFLTNCSWEVLPVRQIVNGGPKSHRRKIFTESSVTRALQLAYRASVRSPSTKRNRG